jgi:hypothetical protein
MSMTARPLIEDCIVLDLDALLRDGTIVPGRITQGTIRWRVGASVDYTACVTGRDGWLRLRYAAGNPPREVRQEVPITSVPMPRGGIRHYFVAEGGRASKLHLPPGGTAFCTRRALGLTYRCRNLGARKRGQLRAQRIVSQLGGGIGWQVVRPQGMPTRRWCRLRERLRELSATG